MFIIGTDGAAAHKMYKAFVIAGEFWQVTFHNVQSMVSKY